MSKASTPSGRKRATFHSTCDESQSRDSTGGARDLAVVGRLGEPAAARAVSSPPAFRRRSRNYWSTNIESYTINRSKRYVWEDAIADVGALYPQGVNAIGKLSWTTDEELQREPARFAAVRAPSTDADNVVKLLLSYWCIRIPSVLISITGGAQELSLEPRLEHLLKEGLNIAARSTRAWVITGGTDAGVMALAGAALHARSTSIQTESDEWSERLLQRQSRAAHVGMLACYLPAINL